MRDGRHRGAVVFDIGNVLVGLDVGRAVRSLAGRSGMPVAQAEEALFGSHHRRFSRGELDAPGFHAAVVAALGRDVDFTDFTSAWCDMFDSRPEIVPLVEAVAAEHPIYLCSNTDPLHYPYLQATQPVLSFARGATLSFEVGSEKPEPAIFESLLRNFALDPASTIFVDDRADNVAAAAALGIAGIVFVNANLLCTDLRNLGVRSV